MADDTNGGVGVRNKLSERFLRDLHTEWERSGEATLKILAKENPEAFARLAVGILPKEFEGMPPPVVVVTGVTRGDEVAMSPSLPVAPSIPLPQPELSTDADKAKPDAKELEPVKAEPTRVFPPEPIKTEPIPYPPLPDWR